jgi:preprotein translocase subunit SecB
MQISPLQLSALWIGKVVLEPAVQPFVPGGQITIETNPTFRRNNDDLHQWVVELPVLFRSANEQKAAYEGSVEMTGVFVIGGDFSEEKQMQVIAVNAPSILYSSVREFVAMLTAHGPHGKFVLPSVSFIDQNLLPQETQKAESKFGTEPAKQLTDSP